MVFQLLVVLSFGAHPTSLGYYVNKADCLAAAEAYTRAECRERDGSAAIYGTCWACMHGCTFESNIRLCGTDPRQ